MTNVFQPSVFQPNVFQVGTLDVVIPDVVTKRRKWLSIGTTRGAPAGFFATGGTKTIDGLYTVHVFEYYAGTPWGVDLVCTGEAEGEVFVLAGAGGGVYLPSGGGGGGGGYLAGIETLAGTMRALVGIGGVTGNTGGPPYDGGPGGDSSFGTRTVKGGGGGGRNNDAGQPGGSGGGAGYSSAYDSLGGTGTAGQGNDGGRTGSVGSPYPSGGGGGAGGPGEAGHSGVSGLGGPGILSDIIERGVFVEYGDGGDGKNYGSAASEGGNGNALGSGGPGLVVVRYPTGGIAPYAPSFAVSRDSAGILIGVRDNAAPQFAVSRDSQGILIGGWPARRPAVTVEVLGALEGYVRSDSADWTLARSGANAIAVQQGFDYYPAIGVQFSYGYYIYQALWSFDTSTIPDGTTVTAVDLLMFQRSSSGASFLLEARAHEWGDTLDAADFVAGDDLAGKTLLASQMSGDLSTINLTALTSESAFASAINTTGYTRIMVSSERQRVGPALEGTGWYFGDYMGTANYLSALFSTRLSITCQA